MRAFYERYKTRIKVAVVAVLAAFGITVAITSSGDGTDVRAHLPRYGQVPKDDEARERQADAALEAADRKCQLTEGEERVAERGAFDHALGDCGPDLELRASTAGRGTAHGCDRSNHNPIYSESTWRNIRRLGFSYCWFKTSEGVNYRDPTVGAMSAAAERGGVVAGGYHFARVCINSPVAEGRLFVEQLRRFDLVGPDRLRPALDVEYGGCSTQAGTRAWIAALRSYVVNATKTEVVVYTGGWWSNPRAGCLFCALPKNVLAWISGYPSAPTIPGKQCPAGQNDIHQYTSSGDRGLSGDINRLECGTSFGELLGAGRREAPPEARHQCRMHGKYSAWYRKYSERLRKRHAEDPPRELDAFGARRLKSATDHLYRIRHYFVKNHEGGTVNYDCKPNGEVVVREVKKRPKPKPRPRPSDGPTSMDAPFRLVGGRAPAPALIAPYIDIITDGATVNSIYRGEDAKAILHAHGLHTQAELFATLPPGVANPPRRSTHELRSDGRAYPLPIGTKLDAWQVGFDVNDADVPGVIRHAKRFGWIAFQPYKAGVEFHHLNFLARPSARGELRDKIRARRERLPTR